MKESDVMGVIEGAERREEEGGLTPHPPRLNTRNSKSCQRKM